MKYAVKNLQPGDINPAPFKSLRSPLRDLLIIGENAKFARIDPAHTFAIDGIAWEKFLCQRNPCFDADSALRGNFHRPKVPERLL